MQHLCFVFLHKKYLTVPKDEPFDWLVVVPLNGTRTPNFTHTMFWDSQIIFMKKHETKVLYPTIFFYLFDHSTILCVLSQFVTTRRCFVRGVLVFI